MKPAWKASTSDVWIFAKTTALWTCPPACPRKSSANYKKYALGVSSCASAKRAMFQHKVLQAKPSIKRQRCMKGDLNTKASTKEKAKSELRASSRLLRCRLEMTDCS